MNQPKTSHWASLAAALGAAPAENLTDEPSSKTPVSEEKQEFVEPVVENQPIAAATQDADLSEPVAEDAPVTEEPAAEEAVAPPPTKRHWAGLAQSLGLPVERLFGKMEPAAAPPAPKPPAPKPPAPVAKQPEPVVKPPLPASSVIEKVMQEKPQPSHAESTARTIFDERNDSPDTEKRAASLFIQIDSPSKKQSEPTSDAPRNLLPGDEIFFDTGDYDLIDDMQDEPVATNYDRDDHEDDDDAPREVVSRQRSPRAERAPKVERSPERSAERASENSSDDDSEDSSEEATDESGAPRPRRRRRRRGRRRDPRTETTSAEEGADEDASTEATEVSAELEPTAKKSADSEEDSTESGGAPRRRRRRRRSRKADEGDTRKTPEVAAKRERVLTDVDFPEDDEDDDDDHTDASLDDVYDDADDDEDDEDQDLRRHRNIPSWLDAVTSIVELNIERHKTAPQHADRRSGGGGGGRRRRGGGRRPAAN